MSVYEVVSTVTFNSLMNKSKSDLAHEILHIYTPQMDDLRARLAAAEARAVAAEARTPEERVLGWTVDEQTGVINRLEAQRDTLTARVKEVEAEQYAAKESHHAHTRLVDQDWQSRWDQAREQTVKNTRSLEMKVGDLTAKLQQALEALDDIRREGKGWPVGVAQRALASIDTHTPLRAPDGQEVKP